MQGKHKPGYAGLMKHLFDTTRQSRKDAFAISRRIPLRSGGTRAVMRGKADQHRSLSVGYSRKLADVPLALPADFCRASVADVLIMFPYDDFRRHAGSKQMSRQRFESIGHVPVTQIPGRYAPLKHCTVIALRALRKPRILFDEEKLVPRQLRISIICIAIFAGAPAKLAKLGHDFILAGRSQAVTGGIAVTLAILMIMIEACVPFTRTARRFRINAVQIAQHFFYR